MFDTGGLQLTVAPPKILSPPVDYLSLSLSLYIYIYIYIATCYLSIDRLQRIPLPHPILSPLPAMAATTETMMVGHDLSV